MDFEFAKPVGLLLVALVPAVMYLWRRRPKTALRWANANLLTALADKKTDRLQTILWSVALLAGALALTEPQLVAAGDSLSSEGVALMLIADVSGSMAEQDVDLDGEKVSRLEAVKHVFQSLIESRPHDRIGLI